nr:MAG TPA: hypothetical protein [Caudoviricetes sp.]
MLTLLTREITENIITAGSHAFARSIIQTIYDRSLALAQIGRSCGFTKR